MAVRALVLTTTAMLFAPALTASATASYSIVPSPDRSSGDNVVGGVSASSPSDGWAVGSFCCATRSSGADTLALHWDGATWQAVPSPAVTDGGDSFTAVADLAPTNAWAVGVRNGYDAPMIAHWNGVGWHVVSAPAGVTAFLRGVSADGPNDVWAVGDDGADRAVVLRFQGHAWVDVPIPKVGYSDMLQGVKAFSASNVWAVGDEVVNDRTFRIATLILHWNGYAWQQVPSPSPDPTVDTLHAIAGSPQDLWAVGQQGQDSGLTGLPPGTRTLTLHWNGQRWRDLQSKDVGNNDTLNAIAASGDGAPTAFGGFETTTSGGPVAHTLAESWDGNAWTIIATPNAGRADNVLQAAAAVPGSPTIWALGSHYGSGDIKHTLILKGP